MNNHNSYSTREVKLGIVKLRQRVVLHKYVMVSQDNNAIPTYFGKRKVVYVTLKT